MTVNAKGMLVRAARSITSAVDLGASTGDVMLATVQGLRGHDHPAGSDRTDSRELAALYPKLLGSGAEGEPSMFELLDDADDVDMFYDEQPDQPAGVPDDVPSPSHGDATGSTEGAPVSPGWLHDLPASAYPPGATPLPAPRPKRHYPHRRAMTLRLEPAMWRRLRQAALDHETHSTDIIRAALERHLAHLDAQKTRSAAS